MSSAELSQAPVPFPPARLDQRHPAPLRTAPPRTARPRTAQPRTAPARCGPEGPGAAPPLRLTRRGRRLVAGLSVATGLVLAGLSLSTVPDGGPRLVLAGQDRVVVEAGDTLWSIAREVAPQEDTRVVVDALREVNDLHGTLLVPGRVLRLP